MLILITGANGFLGKYIRRELSDNHDIKCLSRIFGDYKVYLENEIPNFNQKFELVIHAAGKAHFIPKTESERNEFHNVNVIGTINLLRGLENSSIPKQFVFISSVSVYGKEIGNNINEQDLLSATEPYGVSKIEAEKIVQKWCDDNEVICTILRLPLLVGLNPPGNLGAMIRGIEKGYYFNIGGGKARKSMVLAEDIASFIPKVASVGGVYNLTDGFHPNFFELSMAIANQNGKTAPINIPLFIAKIMGYVGDKLGNKSPINSYKFKKITSDLTFDDTKARKVAGWKPQSVLDWYSEIK